MAVERTRWRGEPALTLRAGPTTATFLPDLGMTGVSLCHEGREHLATPGGPRALRGGHTLGLPLLAPWANRLGLRHFPVSDGSVDLRGDDVHTDAHGLPIHGLLVGAPGWRVVGEVARRGSATLTAARDLDTPAFPFPHRIEVGFTLGPGRLDVRTTVLPTSTSRVPIAFGWHPYLRVPGAPRSTWRLVLPARLHRELDADGLPTDRCPREAAEARPIGRRTFDDLYELPGRRILALETDEHAVELRCQDYPFAQVWVPPRRAFAALEPMTVPTNALVHGDVPYVAPGDAFSTSFAVVLR